MGEGGAGEEGVGVELLREGVTRDGGEEPAGEGEGEGDAPAVAEYFLPALLPRLLVPIFSFPIVPCFQLLLLMAGEGPALVTPLDPAVVGAGAAADAGAPRK